MHPAQGVTGEQAEAERASAGEDEGRRRPTDYDRRAHIFEEGSPVFTELSSSTAKLSNRSGECRRSSSLAVSAHSLIDGVERRVSFLETYRGCPPSVLLVE
jgi:hypothetical protein